MEILINFKETGDWSKALEKAIPLRKGATSKVKKEEEVTEEELPREMKEEEPEGVKGEELTDFKSWMVDLILLFLFFCFFLKDQKRKKGKKHEKVIFFQF